MTRNILYAALLLPARVASQRIKRQQQSLAAQQLLEVLETGITSTATSKSHSRTAIAVAAGNAAGLSLGIDIELMAQDRPFAALGQAFLASTPTQLGMDDFYRCWTFTEAYFKAFQRFPSEVVMQNFIGHLAQNGICYLDDHVHVLQQSIDDLFRLCIVWRAGTSEKYDVRQIPIEFPSA